MAIQKRFIHFKKFSDFNSKKLSANEANTQYTVGISGEIQDGEPDVLYQSYCWIKDTQNQWTHGQLYDGSIIDLSQYLTADEIAEVYATIDALDSKQDTLVSGTNIKTINGKSIVGSGNIEISGGASSEDKIVTLNGDYNLTIANMEPEKIYIVGRTLMSLTIESFADNGNKHQQYDIVFKMGLYNNPALTLTLPDNVLWVNGVIPEIEADTPYELSITCSKHGVTWNTIVYKAVLVPFKSVE